MEPSSPLDFVAIRNGNENDEPFIFNSWLRSYINSEDSKHVPKSNYYVGQHKVIEDTLNATNVRVAHHFEDVNHVLGYIVFEYDEPRKAIVHWLFVKRPFRSYGIARMLWKSVTDDAAMVFHTHSSFASVKLKEKYTSVYNPYLKIGVRL